MLVLVAVVVLLLFTLPGNYGFKLLSQHPEALATVNMEAFAPLHITHYGDWVVAALLGFLLLSNAARMVFMVMRGSGAPLSAYILEFKEVIVHLLTQKRWSECTSNTAKHWIRHIFLVTGYATMFILVVIFLPWFQRAGTEFHWTSLFGYYGTVVLLAVTIWMMADRAGKKDQIHKHSELSDWLFPLLLFLTALTGIFMHMFRLLNLPMPTYVMYLIHLMVAVPMLVIEVPFGKWAHLLYRPLAVYLTAVKRHAPARLGAAAPAMSRPDH